mmetsp:Transcript_8174/g.20109  ORF Transcript_8174/g.20109 Transcript_8174/m.20109 type:complete len:96 (-) Transcript_8174:24-311(-)
MCFSIFILDTEDYRIDGVFYLSNRFARERASHRRIRGDPNIWCSPSGFGFIHRTMNMTFCTQIILNKLHSSLVQSDPLAVANSGMDALGTISSGI